MVKNLIIYFVTHLTGLVEFVLVVFALELFYIRIP